jgi:hypothetical protein
MNPGNAMDVPPSVLYLLLMDLPTFLQKFRFTPEQFERSGLEWNQLQAIADDYRRQLPDLEAIAR